MGEESDIEARVLDVVAAHGGNDPRALSLASPLVSDEDELDIIDVLYAIEEALGVALPPECETLTTIGEAVAAVTLALGGMDRAASLRAQAAALIADGRSPDAIELLTEAIALAPRASEGHQLLARAHARCGDWARAAEANLTVWDALVDAPDLAGSDTEAPFVSMTLGLTQALLESGQAMKAVNVAERTLAVATPVADLLYNLACAHARLARADEAADALRRAAAIDPSQLEDARSDRDFEAVREHQAMRTLLMRTLPS